MIKRLRRRGSRRSRSVVAGGTVVFVANATSKLGGLLEMSTLHSTYLTVPVLKTDIHEWF